MSTHIRTYQPADRAALAGLLQAPELAAHFDFFQGPDGVERLLSDPHLSPEGVRIAAVDGEDAGFAVTYLLPREDSVFAMQRIGVCEPWRRRGLGTALVRASEAWAAEQPAHTPVREFAGGAWLPNPAGEALAAREGYVAERTFWLMERPRGGIRAPEWPAGITLRAWDGSDAFLADAVAAYNDSFAAHYRHVHGTVESLRAILARANADPDGMRVAYRGTRALGFCRCERFAERGEIALLGTIRDARGIGLGRALLRWGVQWLEAGTAHPVTLLVDGENESALQLYRGEGFTVARTRRMFAKPNPRA